VRGLLISGLEPVSSVMKKLLLQF